MSDQLYLTIDQGGHASRVMVFDRQGSLVAEGVTKIETRRDQDNHIEHDPDEMIASIWSAFELAMENLGDRKEQIKSSGDIRAIASILDRMKDVLMQKSVASGPLLYDMNKTVNEAKKGSLTAGFALIKLDEWQERIS